MSNPKFDRDIELASRVVPAEGSGVLRGVEKREVEDLTFEELEGTQKEGVQLLRKFELGAGKPDRSQDRTSANERFWTCTVLTFCTWPLMASSSPKMSPRIPIRMIPNRLATSQILPSPGSSRIRCTEAVWR